MVGGRHRTAGRRSRGDIQGLRAVAVLAVVLYHAGVPWLGGGFAGVDCFFVISGFLITGLLVDDAAAGGAVHFAAFYARRARRILPAAVIVLLVIAVASVAIQPPLEARQTLRDALAAAGFVANYRFASLGTDYLSAESAPSPVLHYWSLGVEEQFYLLWPLLVAAAAALTVRRSRPEILRRALGATMLAVAVASFGYGVRLTHTDPPWAFFSLASRAWELAAGGLLALAVPWLRRRAPNRLLRPLGWLGVLALAWTFTRFGAGTPFPGTAALLPVLGAVAVLAAGVTPSRAGAHLLLDRAPLRYVGDRSYSWYLWHWPVLILAPVALHHPAGPFLRAALVVASFVLAAVSFRLVENPIRFARPLRGSRPALVMACALVAAGAGGCVGLTSFVTPPTGHGIAAPVRLQPVRAVPSARASARAVVPPPWRREEQQLAPILAEAARPQPVPANLDPPLEGAAADKAPPFVDGCNLTWDVTVQPPCVYTTGSPRVVILGDSHAAQWFPALRRIATAWRWQLESFTKAACPPLQVLTFSPYLDRPYTECSGWLTAMIARVRAEHPALVVLGVARHYGPQIGFPVYSPTWNRSLAATVRLLRATGTHVLVMGPTPKPPADVPSCLSAHLDDAAACTFPRRSGVNAAGAAAERAAVLSAGASYFDVAPLICTATTCDVVVRDLLVYRDDNHLTTSYTAWLTPVLQPAVLAALRGEPVD